MVSNSMLEIKYIMSDIINAKDMNPPYIFSHFLKFFLISGFMKIRSRIMPQNDNAMYSCVSKPISESLNKNSQIIIYCPSAIRASIHLRYILISFHNNLPALAVGRSQDDNMH